MIRRRDTLRALSAAGLLAAGCAPVARRFGGGGEEGGIGGTGIFGTVTALGSLRVNGLRVETGPGTMLEAPAGAVQPGEVVAVEAERDGAVLRARRVAVFEPLLGPAETLPDGRLVVLGTPVLLGAEVPVRAANGAAVPQTALRPGIRIAVSGLWRGDAVVATSLRLAGETGPAALRGQLRRRGFAWQVGGTRLRFPGPVGDLAEEGFVTLRGLPGPDGLQVESLDERPLGVFARRVEALSVEGFAARNRGAPGFHLSGFGLPLDATSPAVPLPGERRLLLGRYSAAFRVAESLPLPEDPARRAETLEEMEAAAAIRRWLREG
jgi:hypothetical protein